LYLYKMKNVLWKIWDFHSADYRMPSSKMLHRVAVVRADVSEECSASIIRVTKIGELGTLAVNNNWSILR
jgi:demethoxyubiquinone hydroxylase (CLK1/Coq7/Cat5 family)